MKLLKLNFLVFFTILGLNNVSAQNYEIEYEEFFIAMHGSLDYIKSQLIIEGKQGKKDINGIKTHLLYNQGISLYKDTSSSVKEKVDTEKTTENEVYTKKIETAITYKNQSKDLLKIQRKNYKPTIYGEDILIEQELPNFEWEITNIEETISGYKCKLAKTTSLSGLPILVWYTDQIPLNDGPREYWGLPGLIIQLEINKAVLIIAKSIKKMDQQVKIEEPIEGNKMTAEEFNLFRDQMNKPRTVVLPDGREVRINQN